MVSMFRGWLPWSRTQRSARGQWTDLGSPVSSGYCTVLRSLHVLAAPFSTHAKTKRDPDPWLPVAGDRGGRVNGHWTIGGCRQMSASGPKNTRQLTQARDADH